MKQTTKKRCPWGGEESMLAYHDMDWGVPVHNDRKLFEMLILEGAQAGLSWRTILNRRTNYKKAFANFDPNKVAAYTAKDVTRLLKDEGIIRNKLKINSAINNAKHFLEVKKEFGTFDAYVWGFVNNKPIINKNKTQSDFQYSTPIAEELSKDLKTRGFNFVGPGICYAFMQSVGMVNDHMVYCYRWKAVQSNAPISSN